MTDLPARPRPNPDHASFEEQMNAGRARLDAENLTPAERSRRIAEDNGRTRAFRATQPGANQQARVGDFDWAAFEAEQAAAQEVTPDRPLTDDDVDLAHGGHGDVIDTGAADPDRPAIDTGGPPL